MLVRSPKFGWIPKPEDCVDDVRFGIDRMEEVRMGAEETLRAGAVLELTWDVEAVKAEKDDQTEN